MTQVHLGMQMQTSRGWARAMTTYLLGLNARFDLPPRSCSVATWGRAPMRSLGPRPSPRRPLAQAASSRCSRRQTRQWACLDGRRDERARRPRLLTREQLARAVRNDMKTAGASADLKSSAVHSPTRCACIWMGFITVSVVSQDARPRRGRGRSSLCRR